MQRDAISQLSRTNRCNSSEIFMTVYSFSTSPIPMSWYFGFIDFFVHDVCVTRLSLKRNCLISLLSIISTRESVTYINQHVEHFILQSICDVEWNAIITFKLCCSRTWWGGCKQTAVAVPRLQNISAMSPSCVRIIQNNSTCSSSFYL